VLTKVARLTRARIETLGGRCTLARSRPSPASRGRGLKL
jgi:hypothetical protein